MMINYLIKPPIIPGESVPIMQPLFRRLPVIRLPREVPANFSDMTEYWFVMRYSRAENVIVVKFDDTWNFDNDFDDEDHSAYVQWLRNRVLDEYKDLRLACELDPLRKIAIEARILCLGACAPARVESLVGSDITRIPDFPRFFKFDVDLGVDEHKMVKHIYKMIGYGY